MAHTQKTRNWPYYWGDRCQNYEIIGNQLWSLNRTGHKRWQSGTSPPKDACRTYAEDALPKIWWEICFSAFSVSPLKWKYLGKSRISEECPKMKVSTEFRRKVWLSSIWSFWKRWAWTDPLHEGVVCVVHQDKGRYQKEEVGTRYKICRSHKSALFHNKICSYF